MYKQVRTKCICLCVLTAIALIGNKNYKFIKKTYTWPYFCFMWVNESEKGHCKTFLLFLAYIRIIRQVLFRLLIFYERLSFNVTKSNMPNFYVFQSLY